MKKIVIAVSALLFSFAAIAQESLGGKYSGSITRPGPRGTDVTVGISMEISTVEGGIVKGKATFHSRGVCAGEYPVEGQLKGDVLDLRSTQKGEKAGDCELRLRLTVEGNKLVGTWNKREAQLSK